MNCRERHANEPGRWPADRENHRENEGPKIGNTDRANVPPKDLQWESNGVSPHTAKSLHEHII